MLFALNASAAERYIVVLKNKNPMRVFSSITEMKTNLKKETYAGIADLQSSVSLFSYNQFKPEKVFWGIRGFSALLSAEEVNSLKSSGKVEYVYLDKTIYLNNPEVSFIDNTKKYTYGLTNIHIPELNNVYPEITGKGIKVGIIDTGIDASHPDLKGRLAQFKDCTDAKKADPYDDNGHGTHVAGTISGGAASGTQIGVAPEVTLIVAKVFTAQGGANDSDLLAAMQWMLDPDDNPATEDQPAIVSNSWGGDQDEKDPLKVPYKQMIDMWLKAGIFPSFAAGNSGSNPNTVGVPGGLLNAYAVCAVDNRNKVAFFSSRGPTTWLIDGKEQQFIKPDICAPGVGINSSLPGGKYGSMSGTSMATPHLSGVVALMKQANPKLAPSEIVEILNRTTQKIEGITGKDNAYGYGLVDAKAAVEAALSLRN